MKKILFAILCLSLSLGFGGCCSTMKACKCGMKECPACSASMKCAKCGMTKDKCSCPKETVCPKCNIPKSQCKCM